MKRASDEFEIKSTWPFFWKPCLNCLQDFRWEWGWSIARNSTDGEKINRAFICQECTSNIDNALALYIKRMR